MSNQEVSLSMVGGIALADLIQRAFTSIVSGIEKTASDLKTEIFEDFSPYMEECYRRNRFVRILCQSDGDVDLLEVYVPTRFSTHETKKNDFELIFDIASGENHVITGAGGAGKTFFMRKMWIDLLTECRKVPLFVELRKLNELSTSNIDALIRASISSRLSQAMFEKFCAQGRFIFILDGFDELPLSQHEEVQSQILRLSEQFGECGFVVSGRPDGRFAGWSGFKVYEADAFSLEQTKELCSKIPFDDEYREHFRKILTPEFYSAYQSFLSNPLLAIMMMMVFRRNMDIPKKMGIFYDEAFGTLYQWHDSTKAFKRQKHMDIQEFRRSFGAFCLLSYAKEKFDFSRTELDDLIEKSSDLIGLKIDKDDILDDYERNVNLIRQDGIRYYFIHRSFQEYFAAWALTNIFPHKFREFSDKIERRPYDSVIKMCYDLQKGLVVSDYIKPRYEAFKALGEASSKLSGKSVWKNTSILPKVHVFRLEKEGDGPHVGFSLNFSSGFLDFYRNISLMRGEMIQADAMDKIMHVFITDDVFKILSLLIKGMSDISAPASVEFSNIDIDERTYAINVNEIEIEKDEKNNLVSMCQLPLTDDAAKVLEEAGKKIAKEINMTSRWSLAEINAVEKSDEAIDKMFF